MAMAKITIIGNLGGDPEMRYLPNGDAVTNFNVAVNRRIRGRDGGEDKEETDWYRVSCFRRLAEVANEYLAKVYLMREGLLHRRSDEAVYRVIVPIAGGGEEQAEARGIDFIRAFYPPLRQQMWVD